MAPHHGVHGGRHHDRLVGRKQGGGGKVVCQAMSHLGNEIGAGGRHHHQIGLARQPDMAHLAFISQREQILIDLVFAQGRHRERGDEFRSAPGQDCAHRGSALAQAADQLQALKGGDPTGDHQQYALAGQHGRSPAPSWGPKR